ncbi:DUF1553 domain-containing protein [Phragmitibacter flavus]|uniref:DUF1553 domain-containing protein n=2 Tax=Phragmitibacter flavus TaxID=2576071 RepID=A0A5R8KJV4_9BACT|nr:DUF1553 domain-containing protein [Phragmitibacter flavus]
MTALILLATSLHAKDTVSFNRDIRPILSDTCFHCHGFDQATREGGLRLDLRDEALKSGKSGLTAIVPGQPSQSEIIARIFAEDPSDLMPPKKAHKTLTPEQKELFRRWVEQGAKYEEHWAYTPLAKPELPAVEDSNAQNPIDRFIQARLAQDKIAPSPQASKRDLLRRLSLDLTGLPPSPEEMQTYLADTSPEAYNKQIDRLLKSPHYGERMAVWWMDLARFTDTVGYHGDQNHRIFPYRDYVINAFNQNKPFDQFTIEQLAGDLLPNPTQEQIVATGFNRLNMMTREGGAQPKEYLAKYGAERARTVATTWLGSTFGCAECHDHKFDPISQRDFYALQAFFADVKQWGVYSDYKYSPEPELNGFNNDYPFPPEIEVESPYLKRHLAELKAEALKVTQQSISEVNAQPEATQAFQTWRDQSLAFFKKHPTGWETPMPEVKSVKPAIKGKPAADLPTISVTQNDGSVLFTPGEADDTTLTLTPESEWVSALRIELLPLKSYDGSLFRNKSKYSTTLTVSASLIGADNKPKSIEFHHIDADKKQPRYSNGAEIIGISSGWQTSIKHWDQPHTAVALLKSPVRLKKGERLNVKIAANLIGHLRVSTSPFITHPLLDAQARPNLQLALEKNQPSDPTVAEAYLLSTAWHPQHHQRHLALHHQTLELRDGKTWTMVTQSTPNPLTVRILPRGNWMDETGAITPPATPEFLPAALALKDKKDTDRASRLELAQWLCSDENPLTARTVTNRLWKEFFGNGLSSVIDDLGAQGEPPSHPELLNWLAADFRDNDWNLQHLIRLIVTSKTYQQKSSLRPELKDLDPNNRLLASQNPRRLEAEFVRDNALQIAGLLNLDDIGGPSVKPYQPPGYYENIQFPSRDYIADTDHRQWRRGLYMHWQRTFLHPMLANFDAPSREECTAFRPQSNTPQQALTLLNDPTFVEAARLFATRLLNLKQPNLDDAQRLDTAFQLALARPVDDAERSGLLNHLETQRTHYRANPEDAQKLITKGLKPSDQALDPIELAAWTSLTRILLNLHETITRY